MLVFFFGSRGFLFICLTFPETFRDEMRPVSGRRRLTDVWPESWRRLKRIPCLGLGERSSLLEKGLICLRADGLPFWCCRWYETKVGWHEWCQKSRTRKVATLSWVEIGCLESNRAQLDQWHLSLKDRIGLGYIFYLLFNVIQQDVCM